MATRIVGIVLVRNEENFVTWAIQNAIDFVDEMLVIDNMSGDATATRLAALAARHPKIRVIKDSQPDRTNRHLQSCIGEDVWVFGLDGDEIYDRDGLSRMRGRVLAGEFARCWSVFGRSLHATVVDLDAGHATGYVSPPAASATKLYNFAIIDSWHPNTQRLHGRPALKPGYDFADGATVDPGATWTASDFRNLHMCFFPRSSLEATEVRANITDRSFRNVVRRPVFSALRALGVRGRLADYLAKRSGLKKPLRYMRGDVVELALGESFGRPSHHADIDPRGSEVEALVAAVSARRAAAPDIRLEFA
ncbi:MAG: glycosyltransferase family A protein [Devosia sp.]|nr:glycosyltransferase family A protein [Devosia sp.]